MENTRDTIKIYNKTESLILLLIVHHLLQIMWGTGKYYPDSQTQPPVKIYCSFFFMFMWPCIVANFFITKSTRCTNFTNLFWYETICFEQFVCPSSGVYSLYTQQWYMSYRFVDSFRAAGPGWKCNSTLVLLLESCLQTCTTYTVVECTVKDDGQTNCPKYLEFHAKINLWN